ncbi:ATP-binding protein [Leifsonia sp. L25]|uniref:ATP-binding protein n=1 Tax=Actinomycetes TaxID=1760 RepID=UPI003D6954B8
MTDLPADDGLLRRGQFRIELVQLLNWGSYDGLHRMPVGRGGIAILGPTGRGKSTVLDAMSAVIMPNPQEFNRAARDDSRQRSERTVYSYARGKTDEVKDAGSDTTTTHFLRPLGTAFPSGAAITWRTELGETVTAARLAWIGPDTSTQDEVTTATVYLLAHGEFPLGRLNELVQEPGSSSPLTRASLARLVHPERDLVTSSQPELRVRLCEELGIGGSDESQLKALTLLRRAQASKGVFSIDELFKSFVLTEPRALSRWETTLSSYREASALYDVFETTRRKLEVLADVPARAEQYAAAAEDATGKRRLLSPPTARPTRGCGSGWPSASATGCPARWTKSATASASRRRCAGRPTPRSARRTVPTRTPRPGSPRPAATRPWRCAASTSSPSASSRRRPASVRRPSCSSPAWG